MNTVERWLPIPGYEGKYDVSDWGRVRSWSGRNGRPRPYVLKERLSHGYPYISLFTAEDGIHRTARNHRLVMLTFVGPCPDGLETRHLDGDKTNNHLENLAYGTPKENGADRGRHGTDWQRRKTHCPQGHPYDEMELAS